MRKTISFFLTTIILFATIITSCNQTVADDSPCSTTDFNPDPIIVASFGFVIPGMMFDAASLTLEGRVAASSQIVLCKVLSMEDYDFNDARYFNFYYNVEIIDILMDQSETLTTGDQIRVTSSEGYLQANKAVELINSDEENAQWAEKTGTLQKEYTEYDYIRCSTWDAIPIKLGKTYLMLLNDRSVSKSGNYIETGREFLYEFDGQTVYTGGYPVKSKESADEVIALIKGEIRRKNDATVQTETSPTPAP